MEFEIPKQIFTTEDGGFDAVGVLLSAAIQVT